MSKRTTGAARAAPAGPAPDKKRHGGPSGKNKQEGRLVRGDAYMWATVDAAVEASGLRWSEWARQALLAAAAERTTRS